ncbi:hypothetical protein NQZ68_026630 [Dissostichus eleginoides]|nr:hypothetical protein NQZ68_026630 [Dissostichus eleginoides]
MKSPYMDIFPIYTVQHKSVACKKDVASCKELVACTCREALHRTAPTIPQT